MAQPRLPVFCLTASDKRENLFGENDNNAACNGHDAVSPLRRVVALEGHTDLQDAEAQQNHAYSPNQGKDKIAQIVYNRQRITGGVGRGNHGGQYQYKAGGHAVQPIHFALESAVMVQICPSGSSS